MLFKDARVITPNNECNIECVCESTKNNNESVHCSNQMQFVHNELNLKNEIKKQLIDGSDKEFCSRNKIESSIGSTYADELNTIYEEQSFWEVDSFCIDEPFIISISDTTNKSIYKDKLKCSYDCWSKPKTDSEMAVISNKKFEDLFDLSDKMSYYWRQCIKQSKE